MGRDQVVIATYPVEILDDGRHLVRPERVTDDEYDQFMIVLARFPQKWEWVEALEGWVSKD